jgi:Flp pilus assembly pilin Flp
MKKLKQFAKNLWNDESGQGTAEYILLIAIVVGVLVMFGPRIKSAVESKLSEVEGQMGEIGGG